MNNRTEDEGSMETSLRNSSTFRALEKTRKEKGSRMRSWG